MQLQVAKEIGINVSCIQREKELKPVDMWPGNCTVKIFYNCQRPTPLKRALKELMPNTTRLITFFLQDLPNSELCRIKICIKLGN
jgi:hypothetical protein